MISKAEWRQWAIYHFDLLYIKRLASLGKRKYIEQKCILILPEKWGHLWGPGSSTGRKGALAFCSLCLYLLSHWCRSRASLSACSSCDVCCKLSRGAQNPVSPLYGAVTHKCKQVTLILPVPLPNAGSTRLNGRHADSRPVANTSFK